jgi:hypothetical protein
MSRVKSTLFRPQLGAAYIAVNTKTNEKIVCRVLKLSDAAKYGPVRSGRACGRGNEFFKIFINDKVVKMNNSLENGTCLSDDKVWEFTGDKIAGKARAAKAHTPKVKKAKRVPCRVPKKSIKTAKPAKLKGVEFISQEALSKII